jgi:hypothetical protein
VSFDVWWTPAGAASVKGLDKPIADAVDRVEAELERVGCAASGPKRSLNHASAYSL